ncbi:MAG: DJ-1/PfpI family protein [Candidatus Eremiobacteraeota bacterium]|nr:DJ-1/PfpI family protein [Candidatus Eremiobacteraeota bacterium]
MDERKAEGSVSFGMLMYPQMTQLDFTGPFEVFSRIPDARVFVIGEALDPIQSDTGLRILPSTTFAACPKIDVLCIPGGPGHVALMDDEATLDFVRTRGEVARLVTSVCTGSLILGAAGLLRGYRATTHWTSHEQLARFGAIPERARIVIDRNRITGAGVTAGIDFAFTVAATIAGESAARAIQLVLEYDPQPPFDAGSPERADADVVASIMGRDPRRQNLRLQAIERAAQRLERG